MIGRGLRARPVRARILNRYSGRKARERRFGEYHADAVHFDGATELEIASLACTDNAFFSFALFSKSALPISTNWTIFVSDENDNFSPLLGFRGEVGGRTFNIHAQGAGAERFEVRAPLGPFLDDTWQSLIASFDGQTGAWEVRVNDAVYGELATPWAGPFDFALNGKAFLIGNGDGFLVSDLALLWVAPGQSLLTGGTILEATRRKFITADNKPVDLGADGSTPTGVAPAIFCNGDATTFGTNLGPGGAIVVNGDPLTNASTSPSD